MTQRKNQTKVTIARGEDGVDVTGVPTMPDALLRAMQVRDDDLTEEEEAAATAALKESMKEIGARKQALIERKVKR